MDLFAAAGIDLDGGQRGARGARSALARTLRVPLIKHKVVREAHTLFNNTPQQKQAAERYAKTVRGAKFAKMKEVAARPLFFQMLSDFLGYSQINPDAPHTLAFEVKLGRGAVDVALGRFGAEDGADEIVAPFELKGPTTDLDAIMPGRGRSPVQQAWDYASDLPGCRWVLVSNLIEIRLYAFGRGRERFEQFDLRKLDDEAEQERLWLLLSAKQLIGGGTEELLRKTDTAYKTITDDLYRQYSELRGKLLQYLTDAADGPRLSLAAAIEPTQKILDRILFIAFAQRTALLRDGLLNLATKVHEIRREPVWRNFQELFRSVNEGNPSLDIWPYNGGLFLHDPAVDEIELPDHLALDLAKLGEWDFRDDVPVTLLGHLFEQSITDLEKLRAESRGEAPPKVAKRKREGVVYTPDIITRFLVGKTLGITLAERFSELLAKHGKTNPANGDPIFADSEIDLERAFWRDYIAALRTLRIVDPACGSGAFLVAAFDALAEEYGRVAQRLEALEQPLDFDPFDEIVTRNLHGVDLNAESVEITRLALWLKTARNKRRLQNLENTIKVGNSLIDDPAFTDHPFDWRKAFPEIFAQGGFDIVIGNPPYVRMELIKPVKPYLEDHYVVAADRTDLYAYFFERGVGVLKQDGRLGYISSSTFFRTGSGENLRTFLGDNVSIEAVVDFGDLQLFEGVTTYPAIVTLRKSKAGAAGALAFLKVDALPKDLEAEFAATAIAVPRTRLGAGSWQFEDDALAKLRDKIVKGRKTLGEVYGAPLYGIKTGLNEAFIVDQETRDRLVKQDKKSAKLLKPFLRGENIKRWRVEPEGLYLINIPRGKIDIDDYPAIRDWLKPFKKQLEARATNQEWFELQQAQLAYQDRMGAPKIVWSHFQLERSFCLEVDRFFLNNKCFFVASDDASLSALLNSSCLWFQLVSLARLKRGGYIEAEAQYVERLSLPDLQKNDRARLKRLAQLCAETAKRRLDIQSSARHRILDLAPPERKKLSRKLEDWWTLDFAAFRGEVKRAFRADIPVKERGEWEAYLKKNAAAVRKLDAEVDRAEREIDAIVYRLFDLTAEEIALLEASIAGQY